MVNDEPLLRVSDVAALAGVSVDAVKKWVYVRGIFPSPDLEEGEERKRRYWRRSTVVAWLRETGRIDEENEPTVRTSRHVRSASAAPGTVSAIRGPSGGEDAGNGPLTGLRGKEGE